MSIYPCDIHGSRIRGPLDAFYVSTMLPEGWFGRRLRSCRLDLESFVSDHESSLPVIGESDTVVTTPKCMQCGSEYLSQQDCRPILMFVYRKGEEPSEHYGNWCERCSRNLKLSMNLLDRSTYIGPRL